MSNRDIVIVHGWDPLSRKQGLWDEVYGGLRGQLQQAGYTVHGPLLPRNGNKAGDCVVNAAFLAAYVRDNGLANPLLVGHSLGGCVVELYMRALNGDRCGSYVILDSSVAETGLTGLMALLALLPPVPLCPPDQVASSSYRRLLSALPLPGQRLLTVNATVSDYLRESERFVQVDDSHTGMVSNPATVSAVLEWAA